MILSRSAFVAAVLAGSLATAPARAAAAQVLAGPYLGAVERVVDGDTIAVRVTVWLQQDLTVLVRLRGIDAPEMRGRCTDERLRAEAATTALAELVAGGSVVLSEIEGDKYFGRVLADVATPEGADVGRALIERGFARAYDGGTRGGWCEIGARELPAGEEVAQADAD